MSWYLFNNSPQRQLRGKKVDGYSNFNRPKLILDWGLGELSPKKQITSHNSNYTEQIRREQLNNDSKRTIDPEINQKKVSRHKQRKIKAVKQAIKILTTQTSGSQAQQQKEQLLKVLNNYSKNKKQFTQKNNIRNKNKQSKSLKQKQVQNKKKQQQRYYNNQQQQLHKTKNKPLNVLNNFQFHNDGNQTNHINLKNKSYSISHKRPNNMNNLDSFDHAKQMRYLQSTLLPLAKQDNVTAVLDHQLSSKININQNNSNGGLGDSRLSGKTHFGNKKNQSAVDFGNGFNIFRPIEEKVKDMNQKLKEMYQYDEWCKKRLKNNQFNLG